MPTHPATIEAVFSAALAIESADERRAYLDRECGGDVQLRERVEALLRANADAGSFLHHPPAGIDVTTGTSVDDRDTSVLDSASVALPLLEPCDKADRIGKLVGKVGEYEIIEIVGQGGMGTVLRAFDTKLSRVVAVKVMAPELAANAEAVKRFLREATTAAAVVHDHVVTIHAVDDSHRPPFLVMEYIDGQTLQQKIDREGALQLKTILRIGSQAAAGLDAAHKTGLIHRDVKPGNILLENGVERVKITDFGLARAADDLEMTKAGMIAGTPQYMSPEQAKGEPIDTRSDLFSLGSVLYTMCAGRPAFRAETTMGVLKRVCEDEPRAIHEVNPEIPPWLEAIVGKLLAKDPADRFQSAAEVGELLSQHLAHAHQPSLHPQPAAITKPRVVGVERRSTQLMRRRWSLAAAAVLLLCAGLSLAETTGVTNVAATVIRIVRGDGTLVVEVDDPNVQILVDGEELVITGAGPKELRLRPGQHELHTAKDGKPLGTQHITITRDGRQVVKVAREQPTPAGMSTRLVWAEGANHSGAISPDGKYLSIVDSQNGDVAVRELATGKNRRLSNQGWPAYSRSSVFSSDSKRVAYGWTNKDRVPELRLIGLDGSGLRVLYPNLEKDVLLLQPSAWSPDGRYILAMFLKKGPIKQIVLVSVADGSVRVLKTFDRDELGTTGRMSLSPDGRYVAHSVSQGSSFRPRDIFLLATDGSGDVSLVEHPADDFVLGWAPDGKRVVFASDRSGSMGIWLIPVAEGKPQGALELVKPEMGEFSGIGLTQSGSFYYGLSSAGQNVYTATLDLEQGKLLSPPVEAIQRSDGFNWAPAWSPDGRYLACLSGRSNLLHSVSRLYIRSIAGKEVRELPPDLTGADLRSLQWSPDGHSLLYAGSGGWGVKRVDVQTGDLTHIGTRLSLCPIMATDGTALLYLKHSPPTDRLLRRDLQTGVEQELYQTSGRHLHSLTLSPDGRQLAFTEGGALKLLLATGGEPRELVTGEGYISTIAWTPDGRHLLFQRLIPPAPGLEATKEMWRLPATGGDAQKLELALPSLDHLRIHPDGRQIAFTASSPQAAKHEVWALENFLPPLADSKPLAAADAAAAQSNSAAAAASAPAAAPAREQPAPAVPTTRQVWADAADVFFNGAPSPDGKYFAYKDAKSSDLAVRELATGTSRRLTNRDFPEYGDSPIFSPDGQQVAYSWLTKDKVYELRTIGLDGAGMRVLYSNEKKETEYLAPNDWSADGKTILANSSSQGTNQIVLVSVADGSLRVLKTLDGDNPGQMRLSPDGRYVAYSVHPEKSSRQRDIYLLATDGSGEVPLIKHPANEFVLGWTADGKRLLFVSNRTGSSGIWQMAVADGKSQGVAELVNPEMGHQALGLTRNGSFFYGISSGGQNVYTASLDVEEGKLLTPPVEAMQRSEGSNWTPAWSPDGRYLACRTHRRGTNPVFYIRSTESNEVRELVANCRSFNFLHLSWSPDGRELLGLGLNKEGEYGALRIDVQTGAVTTLLTKDAADAHSAPLDPFLSQDGKALFYSRMGTPRQIIRRDLLTGAKQELYQTSEETIQSLTLSPDGRQLAFAEMPRPKPAAIPRSPDAPQILSFGRGHDLKLLPTTGGEARELVKADGLITTLAWTPDGRHLLFQRAFKRGVELWRVSAAGGEPQKLDIELPRMDHLRIHPDGRRIAFSARSPQAEKREVWVLENFLPPLADLKPLPSADASAAKGK